MNEGDWSSDVSQKDLSQEAPLESSSHQKLNFVEAALLLQSGTAIYARKVEYLRTLAYQTLEQFTSSLLGVNPESGSLVPLQSDAKSSTLPRGKFAKGDDWDHHEDLYVPWNAIINVKDCVNADGQFDFEAATSFPDCPEQLRCLQPHEMERCRKQLRRLPVYLVPQDDRMDSPMHTMNLLSNGAIIISPDDRVAFESKKPLATAGQTPLPRSPYLTPKTAEASPKEDDIDMTGTHHRTSLLSEDRSRFEKTFASDEASFASSRLLPRSQDIVLDCHKPQGRDRPLKVGNTSDPISDEKLYLNLLENLSLGEMNQVMLLCTCLPPVPLLPPETGSELLPQWKWVNEESPAIAQYGLSRSWLSIEPALRQRLRKVNHHRLRKDLCTPTHQDRMLQEEEMQSWQQDQDESPGVDDDAFDPESHDNGPTESTAAIGELLIEGQMKNQLEQEKLASAALATIDNDLEHKAQQKMSQWQDLVRTWLDTTQSTFDIAECKHRVETHLSEVKQTDVKFSTIFNFESKAAVCQTFLSVLMMSHETRLIIKPDPRSAADDITHDFALTLSTPQRSSDPAFDEGPEDMGVERRPQKTKKRRNQV